MTYPVAALNAGLEQGQFFLEFQPLIAVHSRSVSGVEALVRWQHPERGRLTPDEFLPAIERSNLMTDLTDWVVRTAAKQVVSWNRKGVVVPLSVNLSATLLSDESLVERVLDILAEQELPTSQLTLEVTETALTTDPGAARRAFAALMDRGVRISVDDFGTGYTSLAALRDHKFDEVKVDRSFVSLIRQSPADVAVVRAIVDLGHRLGLDVVAEGVEDETTARMLEEIGCDILQGFCFARPMPPDQVLEWIQAQGASPPVHGGRRAGRLADVERGVPLPGRIPADIPDDEEQRLAAIEALGLADPATEETLDDLVEVAAAICGAPMAFLSVVGADRQWFKARYGANLTETSRDDAFCAHAILHPDEVMEVSDARADSRFAGNPLVTGDLSVRFYAGAPLVTDDGHPLGALCVLDSVDRALTDAQRRALSRLSRVAVRYLESSRNESAMERLCHVMSGLSRMHGVDDIPAAASSIASAAQALLRSDGASVMLPPAPGSVIFEPAGFVVANARDAEAVAGLSFDSRTDAGIIRILATGRPLFIADAPTSPYLDQEIVQRFGIASILLVPLSADGAEFGMLVVVWREPQAVLPKRLESIAEMLADEAATTLSRLYALAALRDAADTDPLTGLLNRRTFANALKRLPVGSSIVVLDLDDFKKVNDEGGHQAGDEVLRSFAAHLRAATRTHDLIARWGGDEFTIALPDVGVEGARAMLRRLRQMWDRTPTFSSGYTATSRSESALAALHRADTALYGAKAAGRDRDRAC